MARFVVDVMPKREILDPQGKAVLGALPRLGFDGVVDVRQGKRFEVDLEGDPTEERIAEVRKMAETLLSNPVIEDFEVRVAEAAPPPPEPEPAPESEVEPERQAESEGESAPEAESEPAPEGEGDQPTDRPTDEQAPA